MESLNQILIDYATKLDVLDILNNNKLILCADFKRNSGTKKQKLILAYRLTFLKIVSDYLHVKLPIIIDSINRETDPNNMKQIVDFVCNEFSGHQVIISTINHISGDFNIITIKDGLLKEKNGLSKISKLDL